ncbi:hypothetical protein FGO68_gene3950 [Halteria grandinella]|uniref:Uncharacterized protein n=1 Tax=Halteria grandinella TaxID=5974 RepID=A0A8J8NGN2_HALGN|nr:hypothetical protein FGO68_gene3950 [Halteria grandinella]
MPIQSIKFLALIKILSFFQKLFKCLYENFFRFHFISHKLLRWNQQLFNRRVCYTLRLSTWYLRSRFIFDTHSHQTITSIEIPSKNLKLIIHNLYILLITKFICQIMLQSIHKRSASLNKSFNFPTELATQNMYRTEQKPKRIETKINVPSNSWRGMSYIELLDEAMNLLKENKESISDSQKVQLAQLFSLNN